MRVLAEQHGERELSALLEAERRRGALAATFAVGVLLFVCLYALVLWTLQRLAHVLPADSAFVSVPLQALFLGACLLFVRSTGLPAADFGLTLEGAGRAAGQGLLLTVPLMLLVLAFKAWASPGPLVEAAALVHASGIGRYATFLAAYLLFSCVQEVVVRGCVQRSFALFLLPEGPRRPLYALLLSNLLYALMHLHLSLAVSVGAFVLGLLWGLLAERQRTVVGVCLSHALLGTWAFFVVGLGVTPGR